ncbi:MAG TPA: Imm63 family immunity protein [Stellaceae bacterium]|nr:Imm63 family immunity protein [Stellaceae bacterium]
MEFFRRFFGWGRPLPLAIPRAGQRLRLDEIAAWVERIDAQLPGPHSTYDLPTYGRSKDGARPHIEIDDFYHYVVVERGRELRRDTTTDLNELLYWVFESVTSTMASSHVAARHSPANGFRRAFFRRQIKLLDRLDPEWSRRRRAEIMAILVAHPFTDGGPQTLD